MFFFWALECFKCSDVVIVAFLIVGELNTFQFLIGYSKYYKRNDVK